MEKKLARFGFFLILAVVVGLLVGWKLLPAEQLRVKVGQAEVRIEIADTAETRSKGLSGRDELAADQGMLFVYDQPGVYGFWMQDMKFSLDFVWIREGRVVEITEGVEPPAADNRKELPMYQARELVDAVLEVNNGWVKQNGIKVGDAVVVE